MTLRLIKSTDPLRTEHLSLCVYALPDYGKTSLAFTASRPLVIDFDGLVTKAKNRDRGDVIRLDSWADLQGLEKQVDLKQYDTIVVDTAGRAVNLLQDHVKTLEMKNCQGNGSLSLQGWGVVKRLFKDWLDQLTKTGKDIILLVHLAEEKSGDTMLDRLDIEGGSKAEIYKSALAICRIVIQGKEQKRYLDFSPHENAIGKNPGQLGLIEYPDPAVAPHILAKVLQQIKDVMNKPAAAVPVVVPPAAAKPKLDAPTVITMQLQEKAQAERRQAAEWFMVETNPKIEEIKKQPPLLKSAIHRKAVSLGLRFNKEKNWYEHDPEQAANGTAAAGTNQATGKPSQSERSQGNAPGGLPGMAGAGTRGHVVTAEGVGARN